MVNTKTNQTYVGIFNDINGGMTPIGNIIKDAWVLGVLPESEDCAGWSQAAIQTLYDKVSAEWEKYAYRVSNMPEEMRARHERVHREAVERARAQGWDPELGDD